jgi:hypothetical protein
MNRGKATISERSSDQSLFGAREALCACALQIIRILFEALRAALRAALARIASFFARFALPVKINF